MNDRMVPRAPEPSERGGWLDAYMPDQQLAAFQPQQSSINFAMIRGVLFRQRWLIAGVLFAALIVGLIVTLLATPQYLAEAKVKIMPSGPYVVAGQDVQEGLYGSQLYEFIATQEEVIASSDLAATIAASLKLGTRYDLLGQDIDNSRPPNMTDEQWLKAKEEIAASILAGSVSTGASPRGWVLTIGFRSTNPAIAAEMANAYADALVSSEQRNSTANNQYALEYLSTQIDETRAKLSAAEQAANNYARATGIVVQQVSSGDSEGGGNSYSTLTAANLASINERAATARAQRIEAEQRWRAIQNLPASQLPEVQNSPVLQAMIGERTSKRGQLAELRQRYNDDFPQIANLQAQIASLDEQIERISADVKSAARSAYLVAQSQENALRSELMAVTGDRVVEQDKQIEFGVLDREAQALRDQLKLLLERYNQVNSAAQVNSGVISKLESASVPGAPYSPNLTKNLGLALVFGFAMAAALVVLRETLDDRVHTLEEIEQKIGLPLLGHTPMVEERDFASEGSNRFSSLMEAYSSIRASIDFSLARNRNVIQFTSSQPGEGKSTTTVILAELFASMGRNVLLIDADIRRPSVARLLEIERPKAGLVEVLLGHAELHEAVVKGVHKNLEILPVGEVPPNPTELLASLEFRNFIAKCREDYSLVLIDCSPVLGLADAPLVASVVDATVFVMEANRVPFSQARGALRRLRVGGSNLIGVVLTKYNAMKAGQAYAYQYQYYQYGEQVSSGRGRA